MSRKSALLTLFKAIASLASLGTLAGCAAAIDFNSPSPLGQGVNGKYWHTPSFVDAPLYTSTYIPTSQADTALINSFDAAVSGNTVQLVGTWHDPNESVHKGYGLLYQDGTGWAGVGPNFGAIASDSGTDLGFVTVAANSSGLFAANFLSSAAGPNRSVSAAFSGTAWRTYTPGTPSQNIPFISKAGPVQNLIAGPRAVSTLDGLGRGFVFMADSDTVSGPVWAGLWQQASANGLNTTLQAASGGSSVAALSGLTARFDGGKQVCVSYELAVKNLTMRCLDVTATGAFDFTASTTPVTLSTLNSANMAGHETATDGAGQIMAVFYQSSASGFHVFASLGANGVFPATPTQIDSTMAAAGLIAPTPTTIPGARPGVAYLGHGKYIAVWVGVGSGTTQLYSATYDPTAGWSADAAITGTSDTYTVHPHPQGLHVFGNGNGNAGFALNKIYVSSPTYAEGTDARVTQVARWQTEAGWLTVSTLGNVCDYNYVGGAESDCSQRPTGVILPSGNSLVFFQDRDNNSFSPTKGNRRLAAALFGP